MTTESIEELSDHLAKAPASAMFVMYAPPKPKTLKVTCAGIFGAPPQIWSVHGAIRHTPNSPNDYSEILAKLISILHTRGTLGVTDVQQLLPDFTVTEE